MEKNKKRAGRVAWVGAMIFLALLLLEAALIRIEGGEAVPLISPLLDFIRRIWDTLLELLRV
jgi:hypothetical protein